MKNFGIRGRNNTRLSAPRYGFTMMLILRGRRETPRKWICVQPLSHFFVSPRTCSEFIENSCADDASVLRVVIFLSSVRFAHWTETKCRDRFCALAESFN